MGRLAAATSRDRSPGGEGVGPSTALALEVERNPRTFSSIPASQPGEETHLSHPSEAKYRVGGSHMNQVLCA